MYKFLLSLHKTHSPIKTTARCVTTKFPVGHRGHSPVCVHVERTPVCVCAVSSPVCAVSHTSHSDAREARQEDRIQGAGEALLRTLRGRCLVDVSPVCVVDRTMWALRGGATTFAWVAALADSNHTRVCRDWWLCCTQGA